MFPASNAESVVSCEGTKRLKEAQKMQNPPLHLPTLQAAQDFLTATLQGIVCEWEQDAIDARSQDNHYSSQLYQNWAEGCDLATKLLAVRFSGLFLEALRENAYGTPPKPAQTLEEVSAEELMLELAARCPEPV